MSIMPLVANAMILARQVSENMTGRRLTTCGTGAASGMMMNCWEQNAGDDYEVIWDPTQLQPGDILVSGGGKYGHTGVVLGYYNDGYIALLSTNHKGEVNLAQVVVQVQMSLTSHSKTLFERIAGREYIKS